MATTRRAGPASRVHVLIPNPELNCAKPSSLRAAAPSLCSLVLLSVLRLLTFFDKAVGWLHLCWASGSTDSLKLYVRCL